MARSDLLLEQDVTTIINRLALATDRDADPDVRISPSEATMWLGGGGANDDGDVRVQTKDGADRIHLQGSTGTGWFRDANGRNRVRVSGDDASVSVRDGAGTNRARLSGTDGSVTVRDGAGNDRISLEGDAGTLAFSGTEWWHSLDVHSATGRLGFAKRFTGKDGYSTPMLTMFDSLPWGLHEPIVPVVSYSTRTPLHGLVYDDENHIFKFQGDDPELPDYVTDGLEEVDVDNFDDVRTEPLPEWVYEVANGDYPLGEEVMPDGGETATPTPTDAGGERTEDCCGGPDQEEANAALTVDLPNRNVGVATDPPRCSLDVFGKVNATTLTEVSDARCKTDVEPLDDALEAVRNLDGVRYRWDEDYAPEDDDDHHLGFLAQDVAEVLPEAVSLGDDEELASLAQSDLVPVLVEAIKEQQADIDAKEAQLEAQDARIADQRDRIEAQEHELDRLRDRLAHQAEQLENQADELERQQERLERQDERLAALESRLEEDGE